MEKREKNSKGTTVYLVRHGTTDWNKALRYQGRADNPLDEEGERQGACLEDYFREIPIDLGVTSPLQRAKKTLMYCLKAQDHEVPVLVEPDVIEIDFGEMDGLTGEEVRERYPEFYSEGASGRVGRDRVTRNGDPDIPELRVRHSRHRDEEVPPVQRQCFLH